jgi:hypothetical protein
LDVGFVTINKQEMLKGALPSVVASVCSATSYHRCRRYPGLHGSNISTLPP